MCYNNSCKFSRFAGVVGTGRHASLRDLWADAHVWVQIPSPAPLYRERAIFNISFPYYFHLKHFFPFDSSPLFSVPVVVSVGADIQTPAVAHNILCCIPK